MVNPYDCNYDESLEPLATEEEARAYERKSAIEKEEETQPRKDLEERSTLKHGKLHLEFPY